MGNTFGVIRVMVGIIGIVVAVVAVLYCGVWWAFIGGIAGLIEVVRGFACLVSGLDSLDK